MKIVIRGVCSNSGFGVATQGLIRTAIAAGHEVKFFPINAHLGQHRQGFSAEDLEWLDSISTEDIAEIRDAILIDVGSLVFGMTVPSVLAKKSILYTTYETIRIHGDYVDFMNKKYNEIWTATNFNKVSFSSSGVTTPIKVIPHYIDLTKFNPTADKMNIENKREFNFILNADLSFRKGVHLLVPAFAEVFNSKDDVSLIMKLTMSSPDPAITQKVIYRNLVEVLYDRGLLSKDRAPILMLVKYLEADKLSSFYVTGDCYVSPHYGEGFGLTIAEAMACGVPVLATKATGPVDYLGRKNTEFINLDTKVPTVPVTDPWQLKIDPRYRGQEFYNPSYDSLKEKLRSIYDNKETFKIDRSQQTREQILKYMDLEEIAKKFNVLLGE